MRRLLTEGFRFGVVGSVATAAHLGIALAVLRFGIAPVAANGIGFFAALNVSIFGHQFFSFPGRVPFLFGALRFIPAALVGFLLNSVVLAGLVAANVFPAWVSLLIAVLVIPWATFGYSRFFAYRVLGYQKDSDAFTDRVSASQQ